MRMDWTWAVQADGIRLSFVVIRTNGQLRTGLTSGDFTVTVTNPGDSATSTPTVSELSSKSGQYTALVPAAFLSTNGVGYYHVTIEVDTFTGPSGAPNVRTATGGLVMVTAQDVDDISGGGGGLTEYLGAIWIDTANGAAGTTVGTHGLPSNPSDNLVDALTLAGSTGFRTFNIRKTAGGPLTLTAALDDWTVTGIGEGVTIALNNQDVDGTLFENVELSGIQNGRITALNCKLDGVTELEGNFQNCRLANGLVMPTAGNAAAFFDDCASFVAGAAATPTLNVAGTLANTYQFRGYKGGIEITNSDHANTTGSIDQSSGQVVLGATNTAGAVVLRGVMNISDTSGGGFTATRSAALNLPDIEDEIWDADKSLHTTANSFGQQLQHTLQVVHADLDLGAGGVGTKDDPIGGGNPTGANAIVTRMDAIGAKVAYLKYEGDYIRPTAGDWTYKEFVGGHGSVVGFDPNGQDFNGSKFHGLSFSHTTTGFGSYGAGFGGMQFFDCLLVGPIGLQAMTFNSGHIVTNLASPITLGDAGDYVFEDSGPFRPDSIGQPIVIDFTATAGQRVIFKDYPGRIIIRSMTLSSHEVEIEGRGLDITFDSTCTAGIARVAGWGEAITDNSGGTFTLDQAAYNVQSLTATDIRDVTLTGSAAGSLGEGVLIAKNLKLAYRIDNITRDGGTGFMTSARLRVFPDQATADASTQDAGGLEGAIASATITGVADGSFVTLPDDVVAGT